MTVLDAFFEGDVRALSRLISYVEDREDGYQKLLGRLYRYVGRSVRIGITGPPGAGKSTIVDGLVRRYLQEDKKVGVIAVDPTSPFTGGALLGDRVRLGEFPADGVFYFRSMATRGASGGLAAATGNVTVIYDAFGFDITLIETVGVGQVELDIIDACDAVVVTVVPESGDAVQTMKAGLMEIADVFCVNKADRPGSEAIVHDLKETFRALRKPGRWQVPVVATEALNNKNIDGLQQAIADSLSFARESGYFEDHRRLQVRKKILNIVRHRFQTEFLEKLTVSEQFDDMVDSVLKGQTNPYRVSDELYARFTAG